MDPLYCNLKDTLNRNRIFWLSLALFIIWLLYLGYPVISRDTPRYLKGATGLASIELASVYAAYILRIPVVLAGPWGWALSQALMLAYLFQAILRHLNIDKKWIVTGIFIVSPIGLAAAAILPDIFCLTGLLALYLIFSSHRSWLIWFIFILSFIAHFSNVPLFFALAIIYWLIFARQDKKIIVKLIAAMLITLMAITLVNWKFEGKPRLFGNTGWMMVATRILADSPQLFDAYLEINPASTWKVKRNDFFKIINKHKIQGWRVTNLLWWKDGLFSHSEAAAARAKECKNFTLFAVNNYPWELIRTAAYNTFELLAIPIFADGLILPSNVQKPIIKRFYPEDIDTIKRSLQYWNHMDRIFPKYWYYFCYVVAIIACLTIFLYFLIMRRGCLSDPVFQFCCFAILAMVFNAGLMANASGIFGRYQIRVLAIPFITTFSLVGLIPLKDKTNRTS